MVGSIFRLWLAVAVKRAFTFTIVKCKICLKESYSGQFHKLIVRPTHDCAALNDMLCYRAPYRTQQEARLHQLFAINRCRTAAGARSLMRRLVDA
ncbi:hypothetical protein EVAR_51974_1 [Eumeta japonica]|uniref:Secreted protein n=1 Tax=Eumeta variegata TaxID=151549 RepID=A0A4C1Y0N3_EUMVA|nr:hypothetical protein EVAR_51974_1 [Eumeta japonica]